MNCRFCRDTKPVGTIVLGSLDGYMEDGPVCGSCLSMIKDLKRNAGTFWDLASKPHVLDDFVYRSDLELLRKQLSGKQT